MARTRRALVHRSTAAICCGLVGALAGCGGRGPATVSQSSDRSPGTASEQTEDGTPERTGDRPWYAQWLPPTDGFDQNHLAVTAVETARLREHQEDLQTTVQFELGADRQEAGGHRIDRTAHVSPTDGLGAYEVHYGAFSPADALGAILGGTEKTELETRGEFSIYASVDEPTLACAVKDGVVVHTLDFDGWDGTAWLRAAIDARQGEMPTYTDTDEYAAAVTEALGSADLVRGQRVDLNPETRYLAFGTAQTIGTDTVTQRIVVVFESAGAASEDALNRYLDARWSDWRSADTTVESRGNVVTVDASIDRAAFDRRDLFVPTS